MKFLTRKSFYNFSVIFAILFCAFQSEAAGRKLLVEEPEKEKQTQTAEITIVNHPSQIDFDSLDWSVPLGDQYRTQLASGITAYIAVDSTLPLITMGALIRSGSLSDPDGKEGLGSLMTRLLRTGGTEKYNADSLDALIDMLAMKFAFSQGEAHIAFQASFLSDFLDTAMDITRQMFFHPVFQPEKIEKERSIMLESIRHRFVNPAPALAAAYRKLMYPKNAPARLSTAASLQSIKRDELVSLHKNAFGSSDIIISVSGKFDREEMIERLNAIFSSAIKPQRTALPEIAVAPQVNALLIHKPIDQVYVRMGLPLFKRPHPDYYAVSVLNLILGGGGFTSRLGTRVRSDEGLTYSIHSNSESNYAYPGTLFINFFTKTESYPKAISIILEELEKIRREGVTGSELDHAKSSLISELPSSFRSPEDIASTYAWNEFYGRSGDHFAKYPEEIAKLTKEDIKAAAQKYIDPNKISYAIVGDTTAIKATAAGNFFSLEAVKNKLVTSSDSLVYLE
ncbi:MAG: insulinase family protein [Chitinispirillales bacterium]|nr:insulinase family protein [Chitinispirillales bacterium]